MKSPSDVFYEDLKGFDTFTNLIHLNYYQPLPMEWWLVIADIEGSTKAIKAGKYKEVNSVSAATIMAVLNAVTPVKIPYLFGGDGATLCIPPGKTPAVASALVAAKQMAKNGLELNLRIGMVPMKYIHDQGFQVLIGKYKPYPGFQQAMMIGEGISYAESLIKNPDSSTQSFIIDDTIVKSSGNFNGFECRWDRIKSPSEENVSILVQSRANNEIEKSKLYSQVISKIYEIYGPEQQHHPINTGNLKLTNSLRKLSTEARVKFAGNIPGIILTTLKISLLVLAGKWMMKKNITTKETEWGGYKQRLIENTDYRRMENCLKFLLAGTKQQQIQLRNFLNDLKEQGKLVYGIHASDSATITCLVFDYAQDHVHFLDGSDGGFTLAAIELKSQVKKQKLHNC